MQAKVIQKPRSNQKEKLNNLFNYLVKIRQDNFTGYIKINYTQGNIGRVEKFEVILKK